MSDFFKGYGRKEPIKLRLVDLVVLLDNTFKANQSNDIGFEDANQTLNDLLNNLNREVIIEKSDMEGMLWACNLLNEEDKFWHPRGLYFDSFVKTLMKGKSFDPKTNIISEKGKVNHGE